MRNGRSGLRETKVEARFQGLWSVQRFPQRLRSVPAPSLSHSSTSPSAPSPSNRVHVTFRPLPKTETILNIFLLGEIYLFPFLSCGEVSAQRAGSRDLLNRHPPSTRVRPCKRCVGQGKAHQCVDVSTGRRRGRPRRQPGEAEHQLTVPKVEQDDEDSYRAGDEDDYHEAGAEFAQPQTQHPQQRCVGRRRRRESEEADDDDDDADGESEDDSDDNDYDVRVRHVAKRAHIDDVEASSHHLHSFDAMRALLDEQRSLVRELRAMRSELAEVRHTQSLHEQYFAFVMPLIPQSRSHSSSSVIGTGSSSPSSPPPTLRRSYHPTTTNDYHPAQPDVQSPTTSSSSSGSSPQPATFERCRADNMHSFVLPTFLSLITSDALLPQPPQPQQSAVEPPSSFISAINGWEHPLSAAGGYEPMAEASYAPPPHHLHQQPQTTAAEHHHHQRRSRRHEEIGPRQQRHHGPYYGSIRSHHLPARVTITGLYQKDLLIPSYAYDQVREAFNVPLDVRLEVLAHLPSLSHYNITSSAVPFAISDPR